MRNFKKTAPALLVLLALTMSSCFNILEEITFKKDGSGHFKMSVDMGQVKQFMDMAKGMAKDSTGAATGQGEGQAEQMGAAFTQLADMLKGIRGLSNQAAISDTASFVFGYEFDFADIDALNRGMKKIAEQSSEKVSKDRPDEVFTLKGGKFERIDSKESMVDELTKSLMGGDAGADAEQVKMMFADVTVSTVYRFLDQKVDKQNNDLGQISADGHAVTIEMKPFAEGVDKKKMTTAVKIKLK